MTTQSRTLNVGIVGLGAAGGGIAGAIAAMPSANLVGAADTNPRTLAAFQEKYGGKTYDSIEAICADPDIDTLWIATPNVYHCPHTVMAANAGKHVIIEKPMAINLDEAQKMIEACDKNGVQLVCGGSRSSSAVVRKMRELVKNEELGKLKMMTTWASTDWMLRPRRPDEYDLKYGGGVAFRQSPHQVDSMRLIAGGIVNRVRGITGQWMPPRNTAPGAFSALLEFGNGVFGSMTYNAYGYFMAAELFDPEASGPNAPGTEERIEARRGIVGGTRNELEAKERRNAIDTRQDNRARMAGGRPTSFLGDLGLLVVSCERGDIRQSPGGIYVYGEDGTTEVSLQETRGQSSPELMELYDAVTIGKPLLHGGRWGLATLEVSLAIMQSANERRDIELKHQVATPDWA